MDVWSANLMFLRCELHFSGTKHLNTRCDLNTSMMRSGEKNDVLMYLMKTYETDSDVIVVLR